MYFIKPKFWDEKKNSFLSILFYPLSIIYYLIVKIKNKIYMIGFNALGQFGRLGNQMFQFAALKGIARNRGFEYCIPPSKNKNEWTDHQLFNPFKLSNTSQLNFQFIDSDRPILVENKFSFDEKLFNECLDWVSLQGYFQTEKYFKHISDEIKGDFQFRNEILDPCKKMIFNVKNPVSLHVRRTDYITNLNHTFIGLEYYEEALNKINKDYTVLIFSDDPKWCKNQNISMAVCTNKQEHLSNDLLKKIGIYDYFEYVAGSDTFDYCKPDPRHLTSVVEILDGDVKKTLMIGDSETDANAAKAAEIPVILLENGYTEKNSDEIYHNHLVKDFINIEKIVSKYL